MGTRSERPVAIVTGSARGIGRAIAIRLAEEGYAVVVNGRSADPSATEKGAYEVLARLREAGGDGIAVAADISKAEDRERLVALALEAYGRIDMLVNNAGIAPSVRADILHAEEDGFDRLVAVNLKGPYFLTQRVAREMIRLKSEGAIPAARIVFVTSISSFASSTNRGDYCISKAGLSMACSLFADRLGGHDIPVVEVRPGVIATDMTAGVQAKYDAMIEEGVFPQRRWGQPGDIARVIGAIARGDFDYSTGAVVDISGGFNIKRL